MWTLRWHKLIPRVVLTVEWNQEESVSKIRLRATGNLHLRGGSAPPKGNSSETTEDSPAVPPASKAQTPVGMGQPLPSGSPKKSPFNPMIQRMDSDMNIKPRMLQTVTRSESYSSLDSLATTEKLREKQETSTVDFCNLPMLLMPRRSVTDCTRLPLVMLPNRWPADPRQHTPGIQAVELGRIVREERASACTKVRKQ